MEGKKSELQAISGEGVKVAPKDETRMQRLPAELEALKQRADEAVRRERNRRQFVDVVANVGDEEIPSTPIVRSAERIQEESKKEENKLGLQTAEVTRVVKVKNGDEVDYVTVKQGEEVDGRPLMEEILVDENNRVRVIRYSDLLTNRKDKEVEMIVMPSADDAQQKILKTIKPEAYRRYVHKLGRKRGKILSVDEILNLEMGEYFEGVKLTDGQRERLNKVRERLIVSPA